MTTQTNMRESSKVKRETCDLLYTVVAEGYKTSATIFKRAQEKGLRIKIKNIFPYLEFLGESGRIKHISGTRPKQWVAISDLPKDTLNPTDVYDQPLLLMMGYTKEPLPAGKRVSPLQIYEDHGHKMTSGNGRRPVFGIQSGLKGTIYQD
jgi:hypothetical protein